MERKHSLQHAASRAWDMRGERGRVSSRRAGGALEPPPGAGTVPLAVHSALPGSGGRARRQRPAHPCFSLHLSRPLLALSQQALAVFSMCLVFGWVFVGPWLTLAAAIGTMHGQPAATAFFAAVLLAWTIPLHTDGSAAWPAFRDARVWDAWRRYFSLTIVEPDAEEGGGEVSLRKRRGGRQKRTRLSTRRAPTSKPRAACAWCARAGAGP